MLQEAVGGISNEGYWGIPVQAGRQYALSLYLSAVQASPPPVTARPTVNLAR